MKTQLMILALSLVFMGFLGCHEEQKEPTIAIEETTSDSLPSENIQYDINVSDLLDSLAGIEAVPMTHF